MIMVTPGTGCDHTGSKDCAVDHAALLLFCGALSGELLEKFVAIAIFFNDEIEIFVTAAGEIDKDGTGSAGSGNADRVCKSVRTLDRRNDTLVPGEQEECLDGIVIIDRSVFDAVHLVKQGMFGTCSRIIQAAGIGIDGCGISVFVREHDAFEAVHDTFCAVVDGGGMVTQFGTAAEGLYADQLNGIRKERCKHTDRVGTSAHAGSDLVRQVACLLDKLCPGFFADAELEVTDHQREGMRTCSCSDAVNRIFVLSGIGHKSSVNGFFEGLEAETYRNDICAQKFHAGYVGSLFGNVDFAHVDIALESEIGGRCCKSNTVLTRTCLGNQFLLAHVLGQKSFAHAVVEFVGAGMVEILSLEIDLRPAQEIGQVLAMVDRCGTALEILADAAELCNELRGLGDGIVSLCIFIKSLDQLGIFKIVAAIFSEISVLRGILLEIIVKITIFVHVILPF